MQKKSHMPESNEKSETIFEQQPMGGENPDTQPIAKEYPIAKYHADVNLLTRRALNLAGSGVKVYTGYLVGEQGEKTFVCEYYQVRKDGKMIVMKGVSRDAGGNVISPSGMKQITGFEFTFIEPHEQRHEETGEAFRIPALMLNTSDIKRALKFRKEIFDESGAFGFSLRETASEMAKLYEGFTGEQNSTRPLVEITFREK